jgi:hypothetical protein
MRQIDIPTSLSQLAFEFFYWFSRFEFALKENRYLKNLNLGAKAEPGWDSFMQKWSEKYAPSAEATALLSFAPETQIVSKNGLVWQATNLANCPSDLAKVVRLLKTVRNNLFHGGKHGGAGWDDPVRTSKLLANGVAILQQFAEMAEIEADFTQYY